MPFDLYPSIDLRGGQVVRLHRGAFAAETVHGDDPVRVAHVFADAGARWIHVVDLDAARTGERVNLAVVEAICAAVPCRVQASGGVRSVAAGGDLLAAGAARIVVGTGAIERPELVGELATLHPGKVAVGLDARGREVAVRGWIDSTGEDLLDTMTGPDLGQLAAVLETTTLPVIASGGVGSLEDLVGLRGLRAGDRSLAGAIVGRAIYEGRFGVDEALAAVT